jgi:8-oxo-dGTP pyrophosphatase MutT (NUDIX family)
MARALSCGVIVRRRSGELLMGHATGRSYWDIPKGLLDPGETPLIAALRELREEAGLELSDGDVRDLGAHPYLTRKDLHLFVVDPPQPGLSADRCRCSTTYRGPGGREIPEIDAFRWVTRDELAYLAGKNMTRVLLSLDW